MEGRRLTSDCETEGRRVDTDVGLAFGGVVVGGEKRSLAEIEGLRVETVPLACEGGVPLCD
eukprot:3107260-Rhodomonas_salina.1